MEWVESVLRAVDDCVRGLRLDVRRDAASSGARIGEMGEASVTVSLLRDIYAVRQAASKSLPGLARMFCIAALLLFACVRPSLSHGVYPTRAAALSACNSANPQFVYFKNDGLNWSYIFLENGTCTELYPGSTGYDSFLAVYGFCPGSGDPCYHAGYCMDPRGVTPVRDCGEFASSSSDGSIPQKNGGSGDSCSCGEGTPGAAGSNAGAGGIGVSDTKVGDPIDTSTGNSYLQEDDYDDGNWLVFRRFYNSVLPSGISDLGPRWRHSFDRSLEISGSPATTIAVLRPDGRQYSFVKNSGVWTGDSDVSYSLTENYDAQGSLIGYTLFIPTLQHSESYDVHGVLQAIKDPNGVGVTLGYYANTPVPLIQTVTDSRGRQLQFVYSTTNQLSQVTLPDGGLVTYGYEIGTGNLDAVQYPDGKTRRYVYNEVALTGGASLPNALTGTVD